MSAIERTNGIQPFTTKYLISSFQSPDKINIVENWPNTALNPSVKFQTSLELVVFLMHL